MTARGGIKFVPVPAGAPQYPEYEVLLAEANRRSGPFVDPANLYPDTDVVRRRGYSWASTILGRVHTLGGLISHTEQWLLVVADEHDITPPMPAPVREALDRNERHRQAAIAQQRRLDEMREQVRRRDVDAWQATLGDVHVQLDVHANLTARARDGFNHHLGHAVPVADVYSGTRTVRTHPRGRALCESPTRAKPLRISEYPEAPGTPVTCDRCLHWAVLVRDTEERS